jgi:osmotically inducible lipoprotein OsmB
MLVHHLSADRDKSVFRQKVVNMKTTWFISAATAAMVALGGCSTSPTNAQIGTGAGAVIGGVAGNAVFGNTIGTVGGAAAGAVIGNEVGKRR